MSSSAQGRANGGDRRHLAFEHRLQRLAGVPGVEIDETGADAFRQHGGLLDTIVTL